LDLAPRGITGAHFAPAETTLPDWVHVAGRRWTIEESFEHAKDELGLDEYEVRHYHGWDLHITLVMLTQLFLNTLRLQAQQAKKTAEIPDDWFPLSLQEVRRLVVTLLVLPRGLLTHVLHWSAWRRRHQRRTQRCHYRRRAHLHDP